MRKVFFSYDGNTSGPDWCPSGPSASCEAPAGVSLFSQWVPLKLSTSTQGSMLQLFFFFFF